MMVPHTRLLLWTGLAVVPLATAAVAVPAIGPFCAAMLAVLNSVIVFDALRASSSLQGIRIGLPATVRMSKERRGDIPIEIVNTSGTARRVRLGLALPTAMGSAKEYLDLSLPAGTIRSQAAWPCLPLRRGKYVLGQYYLESTSPLGFWNYRSSGPVKSEIRVYPNLMGERKTVAALFLNRAGYGTHAQRMLGQGRDFEKLRDYIQGDSLDQIHWKATAKRGHPVTKMFQVERTQEVYVIIDASRLSRRTVRACHGAAAGSEELKTSTVLERFVTAALVVGLAAEQQGDLFGLLTFADHVQTFMRAKSGKEHFNVCRDRIYTLQPRMVTPDYEELCSVIRVRLRRRAMLFFLTSIDDPVLAESFVRNVRLISRQHLVLVNMLRPAGVEPLFARGNVASTDEIYQRLSGHLLWNSIREMDKVLQRSGVGFSLLENESLTAQLIAKYLTVKQRQLL